MEGGCYTCTEIDNDFCIHIMTATANNSRK